MNATETTTTSGNKELICVWCEEVMRGETFNTQDGMVCADCNDNSFECNDCTDHFLLGDEILVRDLGCYVCTNCYENGDYFFCDSCSEFYSIAVRNAGNLCGRCAEDSAEPTDESAIYRPIDLKTKEFQADEGGRIITSRRLFGVELEIVNAGKDNLAKLAKSLDKRIGITRDGSLSGGYGLEVQTPILKGSKGEETLIDILSKIKKHNFGVNKTCGTHCHLDARDFIPTIEKKMVSLTSNISTLPVPECTLYAWLYNADDAGDQYMLKMLPIGEQYRIHGCEYDDKFSGLKTITLDENGKLCDKDSFDGDADAIEFALLCLIREWGGGYENFMGKLAFNSLKKNTLLAFVDRGAHFTHNDIQYRVMRSLEKNKYKANFLGLYYEDVYTRWHVDKLKALTAFYLVFDDVFLSMLPTTRRNNRFTKPIKSRYALHDILKIRSQEDFDTMWFRHRGDERGTNGGRDQDRPKDRKQDPHDSTRYVGVNFHSLLGKNGTLEIRYHSGTLDAWKILNWIALHQRIMDLASSNALSLEQIETAHTKIRFDEKLKFFFSILKLPEALQTYVEGRINTYNK